MIEVNLLPGGRKKGSARRRPSFSLPSIQGVAVDRWVLVSGLLVVVALFSIGWLHMAVAGEAEELSVRIESAERDAERFRDLIQHTEGLRARRDSIEQRAFIIEEIDGGRYVWPHVLDEIARALPDHTWLRRIQQITAGERVVFRVEGSAGTFFALASLMESLEASHFIGGTTLMSSDRAASQAGGGDDRTVYNFALEAEYRSPPAELIDTEPLFGASGRPPLPDGG